MKGTAGKLALPDQSQATVDGLASGQAAIRIEGGEKGRPKPRRKQSFSLT